MSKYSDKKLAKRMGTYVPPYDRNDDTVRATIRSTVKTNDFNLESQEMDDTINRELDRYLKSKNKNTKESKS